MRARVCTTSAQSSRVPRGRGEDGFPGAWFPATVERAPGVAGLDGSLVEVRYVEVCTVVFCSKGPAGEAHVAGRRCWMPMARYCLSRCCCRGTCSCAASHVSAYRSKFEQVAASTASARDARGYASRGPPGGRVLG